MVSPAEAVEMQRSGSSLHRTDESGFWHGSEAPRDGYLGMGVRLLEMVPGMGVRLLEMVTYFTNYRYCFGRCLRPPQPQSRIPASRLLYSILYFSFLELRLLVHWWELTMAYPLLG